MTEPESGGSEGIRYRRIHTRIVAVEVATSLQCQFEQAAHFSTQDQWKEFPVGDMLNHCSDDSSRLLVQLLVTPVRVQASQLPGDSIVLCHPRRVHRHQSRLFATSLVPRSNTMRSQCSPQTDVIAWRSSSEDQFTVTEYSITVRRPGVAGVNGGCVQVGSGLIELFTPG